MKYVAATLAVVLFASLTHAAEPAATSELPAALQALGVESSIVSTSEAHEVRGQGFRGPSLQQNAGFWLKNGTAVGSTTLFEGVVGNFSFTQVKGGSTFAAEGTFGGLRGSIGVSFAGGLGFDIQGKAFQQQFDFASDFSADFTQSFRR